MIKLENKTIKIKKMLSFLTTRGTAVMDVIHLQHERITQTYSANTDFGFCDKFYFSVSFIFSE